MSIIMSLALAATTLAPPPSPSTFVFNFTTTACYDGNSPLSSCHDICAVGKTGYTSLVTTTQVEVHYSGFVHATLNVVSPESAVGTFPGGITYVSTRSSGSRDFIFVVVLDKAATCTMHANVTSGFLV